MLRSWDDVYKELPPEEIPWEAGKPDSHLAALLKGMKPSRALDICCGTGNDSIFLAEQGWSVSAVDVSATAVRFAREKAAQAGVNVDFRVASVLALPFPGNHFGFINDRGCFHHMIQVDKSKFLEEVLRVLKKGGVYNLMVFSVKERHVSGPHKFSRDELMKIFSPGFEIQKLEETQFEGPAHPQAWHVVMVRK